MKDGAITIEAEIFEGCKGNFKAKTKDGAVIKCTPAGKLRKNQINILIGDRVIIEVSAYDTTRGRIVQRLK
jgi:translation initiation factor IF-1